MVSGNIRSVRDILLLTSKECRENWYPLFESHVGNRIQLNIEKASQEGISSIRQPPFPSVEVDINYKRRLGTFINTYKDGTSEDIVNELENLAGDILLLAGQRMTPASMTGTDAIPPTTLTLKSSANNMYNEFLTDASRAWSKHSHRCPEGYWRKPKGSPETLNTSADEIVSHFLDNYTWWNKFGHFKQDIIFELRDETGHGVRWSGDGTSIVGFVEAIDMGSGREFK